MKSFKDLVNEQAQAKKGNWAGGVNMTPSYGEFAISTFNKIDDLKIGGNDYELYLTDDDALFFILGKFKEEVENTKLGKNKIKKFHVIFGITFSKYKKSKIYGDLYNVDGVGTKSKKTGLSTFMYKYFVKNMGFTILGDSEQYFGARKLWTKLSKELDVTVDLYDLKNDAILEKNVILHHGNYNNDFDKRLWSFSKDKHYIRSILVDLKEK